MTHTIQYYSDHAAHFQALYDHAQPESVHACWLALLQHKQPGTALDVGAGSGRDARWLAGQGWQVVAAEPATALRERAQQPAHSAIDWCAARLPALAELPPTPTCYDLILLSAVWMHLAPAERASALARMAGLLAPGGYLVISLRFGPDDPNRPMHAVSVAEVTALAHAHQLCVQQVGDKPTQDSLARPQVTWQTVVLFREVTA